MFDPTVPDPAYADYAAFSPLVQALVRSRAGSTARCTSSTATATASTRTVRWPTGSPWLSFYGVRGSAANLRRVTVDGSDLGEADWLKVTVQPRGRDLLTFQQVPGA